MTIDEAEKIKTVVENKDYIVQLVNTVAKTLIEAFENLTIEDVNMFQLGYSKAIDDVIDKLAQYEELEEQGLLLRLPAEAYFIKDNIVRKGWVQELVYSLCSKLLLDIRYDDNSLDSYRGYLGNDVFLTQAEAEQKLKEMVGD